LISAGAPPQTPLGQLTALPQTLFLYLREPTSKGKGREGGTTSCTSCRKFPATPLDTDSPVRDDSLSLFMALNGIHCAVVPLRNYSLSLFSVELCQQRLKLRKVTWWTRDKPFSIYGGSGVGKICENTGADLYNLVQCDDIWSSEVGW